MKTPRRYGILLPAGRDAFPSLRGETLGNPFLRLEIEICATRRFGDQLDPPLKQKDLPMIRQALLFDWIESTDDPDRRR